MTHAQKMKLASEHIRLQDAFRKAKTVRAQDAALRRLEAFKAKHDTRRKNPTKAQKREKSRKASVQRRVAVALAKFLKQANPAMKTAGASIQRLKGGVIKITPIKANAKVKR